MMKEQVKFFDIDFLGNKIEIGDMVIFEAPKYRDFAIGTVVTKAPKSCQIEYINNWNYSEGHKEIVRQYYGQVIRYPVAIEKRGIWKHSTRGLDLQNDYECSLCHSPSGVKHFLVLVVIHIVLTVELRWRDKAMEAYIVIECATIDYEEFNRPVGVFSSEPKAQEAVAVYTQKSKDSGENYDYYYI